MNIINQNFIKVPSKLLFLCNNFNELDLYYHLEKNQKFIHISNNLDNSAVNLNKFRNKHLYIKKEYYKKLINISHKLFKDNLNLLKSENLDDVKIFLEYYEHYYQLITGNISLLIEKEENYKNIINLKKSFEFFFLEVNPKVLNDNKLFENFKEKALKRLFYSLFLAKKLNLLKNNSLENLTTVCLFCDIAELEGIEGREHIPSSANILYKNKEILFNNDSYLGILHHHEYIDGSGFFNICGTKIHEFGQIVKLVDDFLLNEEMFFNISNKFEHYSLYNKSYYDTLYKLIKNN